MIEFSEEEKSYLIKKLQLDLIWNKNMSKQCGTPFDKISETITSILFKLGEHPFKTKLEENSKS